MRVAVFSSKPYDQEYLEKANAGRHEITYHPVPLNLERAILAKGCDAVCCFVNDRLDAETISQLGSMGVRCAALRWF